jgi:cell division protein FtsZ
MSRTTRDFQGLPPIKVVGVGGGGCNAVSRMSQEKVPGVQLVAVNTDGQALMHIEADVQIRIGDRQTKGLGAGGDPKRGMQAAEESRDDLKEAIRGAEMVFVTTGMGGGTGTGASPIVAEVARETGALTIGVVTRPFSFEGNKRAQRAEEGIANLRQQVDTLIVIPNDRLLAMCDAKASFEDALRTADNVLLQAIQGISEVITLPGIINLDFADVRKIMGEAGPALLAIGRGRGNDRAVEAARNAITSPLLDVDIAGASGVLFNVVGGKDLGLMEVNAAAQVISEVVSPDAEIVFGAAIDDSLGDEVKVTVIATGFDDRRHSHAEPAQDAWHHDEPQQPQTSRWDDERPAYREPAQQPLASSSSQASSDPRTRNVFADLPDFEHDTELPAFLRRNVTAR